MKFGRCISILAVFIFAIVLPFLGFSECVIDKEGDYYIVRCSGVIGEIPSETNHVYIIEDCEHLKTDLLSAVDGIALSIRHSQDSCDDISSSVQRLYDNYVDSLVDSEDKLSYSVEVDNIKTDIGVLKNYLDDVHNSLVGNDFPPSLRAQISAVECGSCSTNSSGGGSCSCDVDFSEILDNLNDAQFLRISITNSISSIVSLLGSHVGGNSNFAYWRDFLAVGNENETISKFSQTLAINNRQRNVINLLSLLHTNLASTQASLNNYLHAISVFQLPSISNHVEHLDNEFTQFSFFVKQKSPLYGNESPVDGYYSYLTNFYLNVSFDRVSPSETRTNWFSRIETLLAALVFADAPANQLDEDSSTENSVSGLDSSFSSLNDAPSAPLSDFGTASRGVVDSIRSFNSLVSDLTMPSTVVLVRYSDSSGSTRGVSDGGFTIEFESGQIGNLVEASRCVTTLAWTFTGLFFVYWFYHWCLLSCYRLVVFCYSVLSSIFGKS